jgi:hypothetical protein
MTLKEMMSLEVLLNGNVAFLLPFLIDVLIVYPKVKKNSIYIRNFLKKPNFLITFSRSSKRPKRKYQQKAFLKH